MANERNRIVQTISDAERTSLVNKRWADLGILFALSIALGMILCASMKGVQSRVAAFLAPWGWFGGIFIGLVAGTSFWAVLQRFGCGCIVGRHKKRWRTNPPAWPLGVVAFLLSCFLWDCVATGNRQNLLPFLGQATAAILLLGIGKLLARQMTIASTVAPKRPSKKNHASGNVSSLEQLADRPEDLVEWLKREEPISDQNEDCFEMAPYARRIAASLSDTPLKTVALIGPYGCGKSSIAQMVRSYLFSNGPLRGCMRPKEDSFGVSDIVTVEVSGWGFREGSVAEHILERTIAAIAREVDCLELAAIPGNYEKMLNGSPGWFGALSGVLDRRGRCENTLQKIDDVLLRANIRLIAFLEDLDRNVREETFLNEVAGLLEKLKGSQNISFVLAIGEKYQGQDIAAKLGEHIEIVSPPAQQPILRILRSFRDYSLAQHTNDIDPLSWNQKERHMRLNASSNLDRVAEAQLIHRPIDAIAQLLTSPRILKTSLRRTWFTWGRLHGEINFDDLLICNVLRTAATEAFLFVNENVALLRALSRRTETEDSKKCDENSRRIFLSGLDNRAKKTDWSFNAVRALLEQLFPGLNANYRFQGRTFNLQGVNTAEPTDYWARLNREEVADGEIRDQEVLPAIEQWRTDRKSQVYRNQTIPRALLDTDGFADKTEQFGQHLTPKEVRDMATELFALILQPGKIRDPQDYPGFFQLFRISLKSHYESHDDWVSAEICKALHLSLRFANDIFYYWRSDRGSDKVPTLEVRKRFINNARSIYENNGAVLSDTLDPDYPYSIYHLVVLYGSERYGGPGIQSEDWLWLGPILLARAQLKKDTVLPQIAVLLTDYDYNPPARNPEGTTHRSVFQDEVADKVFGADKMADLMSLLSEDFTLAAPNPEMSSRIACCRREVKRWLSEHPQR